MPIKTSEPAFPIGSGDMRDPVGISMRDYFAAKAMQGLIQKMPLNDAENEFGRPSTYGNVNKLRKDISTSAFAYADAMLAEREKE